MPRQPAAGFLTLWNAIFYEIKRDSDRVPGPSAFPAGRKNNGSLFFNLHILILKSGYNDLLL